jgi:hypothetical protein
MISNRGYRPAAALIAENETYSPAAEKMTEYLPDTNILIEFGRDAGVRSKLENARQDGAVFRIGPPALIELVRGVITGGGDYFLNNREVFIWLHTQGFEILDLPRPFMAKILRTSTPKQSDVEPMHYEQLIRMIANSADLGDFLRTSEMAGSAWKGIVRTDDIHRAELDRELAALGHLAKRTRGQDLASMLSKSFGAPGCRPNPLVLKVRFSAAIEFLESSLAKIRLGAKPWKNDRGLYVDFQLLHYLADSKITFLTKEDFSNEIMKSRQKSRIVGLDSPR